MELDVFRLNCVTLSVCVDPTSDGDAPTALAELLATVALSKLFPSLVIEFTVRSSLPITRGGSDAVPEEGILVGTGGNVKRHGSANGSMVC